MGQNVEYDERSETMATECYTAGEVRVSIGNKSMIRSRTQDKKKAFDKPLAEKGEQSVQLLANTVDNGLAIDRTGVEECVQNGIVAEVSQFGYTLECYLFESVIDSSLVSVKGRMP